MICAGRWQLGAMRHTASDAALTPMGMDARRRPAVAAADLVCHVEQNRPRDAAMMRRARITAGAPMALPHVNADYPYDGAAPVGQVTLLKLNTGLRRAQNPPEQTSWAGAQPHRE